MFEETTNGKQVQGRRVMVGRKHLLTFWVACVAFVSAAIFPASAVTLSNVMAEVDDVLARANASGKLALIIMGANWCHDSQGLLSHFKEPDMIEVLGGHYEKLLVDVGNLDAGAEVNKRFGMPVIYGTPTVLIVDPHNERLLNRRDLQQWYNAASISLSDTVDYFKSKAVPAVRHAAVAADMATSEPLKKLFAEIDSFEAQQAQRIYRGFQIVGPMVAMDRHERPKNFYRLWEQLRVLRYKIPDDLVTLRAVARRRVALGETDIKLEFPEYPPLEWEEE